MVSKQFEYGISIRSMNVNCALSWILFISIFKFQIAHIAFYNAADANEPMLQMS